MDEKVFLQKENRFFSVEFRTDLFGGLNIVRTWGRIDGNYSREKIVPVSSEEEGKIVFELLILEKVKRGFRFVDKRWR